MDLQGIGAIASASVALVGIPAAVLIGRSQTRAAVQAAGLSAAAGHAQALSAAEAGIAQAEATYRAALDASRSQARAEYRQWRHTLRREAWASFATSVHAATTAASDLVNKSRPGADSAGLKEACVAASRAAYFAHSVVELEGPASVAEAANLVQAGVANVVLCAIRAEIVEYARARLRNADDVDEASAALDALSDLRSAARARAEGGTYPIREAGARSRAVAEAQAGALLALSRCGITGLTASMMLDDANRQLPVDNRMQSLQEAQRLLEGFSANWLESARAYLDGDGHG